MDRRMMVQDHGPCSFAQMSNNCNNTKLCVCQSKLLKFLFRNWKFEVVILKFSSIYKFVFSISEYYFWNLNPWKISSGWLAFKLFHKGQNINYQNIAWLCMTLHGIWLWCDLHVTWNVWNAWHHRMHDTWCHHGSLCYMSWSQILVSTPKISVIDSLQSFNPQLSRNKNVWNPQIQNTFWILLRNFMHLVAICRISHIQATAYYI